jgi:hypothetical protein
VALKHISNFVKADNNTNIILLNAPHRHDLMESSCINNEIRLFNRNLTKHVKTFNYTMVLEINSNRELFTRHGLHLNGLGKQRISKQIAAQISTILVEKAEGPGDPTPLLENRN